MAANDESDDTSCSLDLSCDSSPFGSIDEDIATHDHDGIMPYMFEPVSKAVREPGLPANPNTASSRLSQDVSEWCPSGNCMTIDSEKECVCCMEIKEVVETCREENPIPSCIALHPGFEPVCLNRYSLRTAYRTYRLQYKKSKPCNERNRYISYRQLVTMCWGYLGKGVRVMLSSCAVNKIRLTFESDDHTGFLEADP